MSVCISCSTQNVDLQCCCQQPGIDDPWFWNSVLRFLLEVSDVECAAEGCLWCKVHCGSAQDASMASGLECHGVKPVSSHGDVFMAKMHRKSAMCLCVAGYV